MSSIKYEIYMPYSVKQMFYLVNDINAYSEFIPGCRSSKILEFYNNELIAELNIDIYGITQSLITHNVFTKNKNIGISLLKGPFKSFYGHWRFVSKTDFTSTVEYVSYYEFSSIVIDKIFNYGFQQIYKNVIKSFFDRASKMYNT